MTIATGFCEEAFDCKTQHGNKVDQTCETKGVFLTDYGEHTTTQDLVIFSL